MLIIFIFIFIFRECNQTFSSAAATLKARIQDKLPKLVQNHILCAGTDFGAGVSRGHSGGPAIRLNRRTQQCESILRVTWCILGMQTPS